MVRWFLTKPQHRETCVIGDRLRIPLPDEAIRELFGALGEKKKIAGKKRAISEVGKDNDDEDNDSDEGSGDDADHPADIVDLSGADNPLNYATMSKSSMGCRID